MKYLLLSLALLLNLCVYTQVGNDDCFNATPLGNLPNPVNCGNGANQNGQGAPITFNNLTNVNSLTENPYTTLINCQGILGNNMSSPATDVWYSFVATGNSLVEKGGGIHFWVKSRGSLMMSFDIIPNGDDIRLHMYHSLGKYDKYYNAHLATQKEIQLLLEYGISISF